MNIYLLVVAALHLFFMLGELLPWPTPFAIRKTNEKLAPTDKLGSRQIKVVANIVRNAGVYNGIVASGLCYAAFREDSNLTLVLLIGVSAAGVFGTVTLRSWLCAIQGILGLVGLYLLRLTLHAN